MASYGIFDSRGDFPSFNAIEYDRFRHPFVGILVSANAYLTESNFQGSGSFG
jgi:hypothetical protein